MNIVLGTSKFAAGIVDVPILGALIDDMADQVRTVMDGAIDRAEGALLEAEIEAGKQLNLAIQNAKNAYVDILNQTVDKVDKAVTDNLSQLTGMVEEFQAGNSQFLEDAATRVEQLIISLPFSNLQPQLTEVKPRNIVLGSQTDLILTFKGVFPSSADPQFPPILTFDNKKFSVASCTTQQVEFKVPVSDIFPIDSNPQTHKFSYKSGDLQIPWDNTSNLPWWKRALGYTDNKTYIYKVLVAALPLSPGRITAFYTKQVNGQVIRQHFASTPVHEDANHAYKRSCKDWDVHRFSYAPDAGFRFVVGTARLVLDTNLQRPHGNHQEAITSSREDGIDVVIKMDACSGKHMGIITFHVESDEVKTTTQNEVHQIPVEMNWSESRTLDIQTSDGTLNQIVFEAFDGQRYEFGTVTDLKNRYLKVYNQANQIQIVAIPPKDLNTLRAARALNLQ